MRFEDMLLAFEATYKQRDDGLLEALTQDSLA